MNTEFFTKPTPKVKTGTIWAYRGFSVASLIFLYATFASKDWVSALTRRVGQLETRIAVEEATSLHMREQTVNQTNLTHERN